MANDDLNQSLMDFSISETDEEKLTSMRERVNWEIEAERHDFYGQLCSLIKNWQGKLPNLRLIFRKEEIDWLLVKCVELGPAELISFVISTGYRDEPDLDDDGQPRWRCVTPVHRLAGLTNSKSVIKFRELFQIYHRFDINYTDDDGYSHFLVACQLGCEDVVERFLEHGQNPNCLVQSIGMSPLHWALASNQKNVAAQLLRRGADPNLANDWGETALHMIGRKKHADTVEIFRELRGLRVDALDRHGTSPLHRALCFGNIELVEFLIRRGADPFLADPEGMTPLHRACKRDNDVLDRFFELVHEVDPRRLVQINAPNARGRTPLHFTLHNGNRKAMESLLRRGANPNAVDEKGKTPLHLVAFGRIDDGDLVETFLRATNDVMRLAVRVDAGDHLGWTPLHSAVRAGKPKLVESLLRRGADPNLIEKQGLTPLHVVALCNDNDWMVEKFLEICRDITRTVRVDAVELVAGRTPLLMALHKGHKKVAVALLRAGANPNQVDAKGHGPLHIISWRKVDDDWLETTLQMIDEIGHNVQIDAKDNRGRTPLHLALSMGNKNAAKSLLRRGANPNLADDKGYTSLHYIASRKIDDDLTDWFFAICDDIPLKVKIEARNKSGNTPLRMAKHYALKNMVKSLLRRDAKKCRSVRKGKRSSEIINGRI